MLPPAFRLKRRALFGRVYGKGRSCATDLVVVYVLPTKEQVTRVGFSVSKKVGNAVVRNRVKRLLREAVRQMLPRIAQGYDVVVIARKRASEADLASLEKALAGLFRRSGLLKAPD